LLLRQHLSFPEHSTHSTPNLGDRVAILSSNRMNTAANNPRSRNPRDFAVVKHTMAVLIPVLPVVGDAAAVLEGMDKVDAIDAGVIEPVASESSLLPATDEGGLACDCGARCRGDRLLVIFVDEESIPLVGAGVAQTLVTAPRTVAKTASLLRMLNCMLDYSVKIFAGCFCEFVICELAEVLKLHSLAYIPGNLFYICDNT